VQEFINYCHLHKKGYIKNNKVCIVTGASRGLGCGIALVIVQEEGCTVYATARNEEAAAGTKGGVVEVYTLDQSDDAVVQDFVEQVKSEENQVDLLVNSTYAGMIAMTPHFGKPFWERPLSVFDASLKICPPQCLCDERHCRSADGQEQSQADWYRFRALGELNTCSTLGMVLERPDSTVLRRTWRQSLNRTMCMP
jgi:NAD(P)-dependent dehydrogenase (short-subunit alcohol dehydrogenase family)